MAQKKIGIKTIAEMAGVAPSTVSHAINGTAPISDAVRDRVLRVARDTGYLNRKRTKAAIASVRKVLLAVPPDAMPENDLNIVSWTILNAVSRAAEARSIRVSVHEIRPDASFAQIGEAAKEADMDAVILLNDDRPNILRALARSEVPAVLINGEDPDMLLDCVLPANRFAATKATKTLLEMGHRRILHLTWPGQTTVDRRREGFTDAFVQAGLSGKDAITLYAKGHDPHHGEATIAEWVRDNPDLDNVTAIFCAADNLAFGAIKALKAAGLSIPGDISVMGFDGVGLGELHTPALSTTAVPLEKFGEAAFDLLETRAQARDQALPARHLALGCDVVMRQSVTSVEGV